MIFLAWCIWRNLLRNFQFSETCYFSHTFFGSICKICKICRSFTYRDLIKNSIITKLQKLYSPPRNLRAGNKSPALFLKKRSCTGDLLPAREIFIERRESSSYILTPPISRVLVGQHFTFRLPTLLRRCNSPRKYMPVEYKARQKAGFPTVTYTTSSISGGIERDQWHEMCDELFLWYG